VSAFFDTNILVYAQQTGESPYRARALLALGGKLSVQVLNESTAVCRRKLGKDWREISAAIDDGLILVDPPIPITQVTHGVARTLAEDHGFSFYDALIVAASIESGCDTLYSEDMRHGHAVGGVTIINPFVAE